MFTRVINSSNHTNLNNEDLICSSSFCTVHRFPDGDPSDLNAGYK